MEGVCPGHHCIEELTSTLVVDPQADDLMTSLFANSLQPLDLCFWLAAHQSSLCPSHDGRSFAYQFSSCSHEDYFTSLCRQRKPTKLSNSLDSAIQPQTAGGVTDRGWANEGAGGKHSRLGLWSLSVALDCFARRQVGLHGSRRLVSADCHHVGLRSWTLRTWTCWTHL